MIAVAVLVVRVVLAGRTVEPGLQRRPPVLNSGSGKLILARTGGAVSARAVQPDRNGSFGHVVGVERKSGDRFLCEGWRCE